MGSIRKIHRNFRQSYEFEDVCSKVWELVPDMIVINDRRPLMKELISQSLLFLAEIGVIVVMLIIILKERRKIKETERKNKRSLRNTAAPKSQTIYLD